MLAPEVEMRWTCRGGIGKRAGAGHCCLVVQARSRRLASPLSLSSSSIASAPLSRWPRARPCKKPPSRLWTRATRRVVVPPLFCPAKGLCQPAASNASRPSRANGRIPGTATASSPSGSGVSCGRIAAALSAWACRPGAALCRACARAQSPSQPVILHNAGAV